MKTIIRTISTFACTLLALSATLKAEEKRVVLTFDDSCKSHATFVAPLLKKNGFSATFYITEGFGLKKNKDLYMTWEEIKQLHDMGFEIGNHTKGHMNMRKLPEEKVITEIDYIDAQCVNHGIPKPVTFAYPGYAYSTPFSPCSVRPFRVFHVLGEKANS
jgi:peptidoglycan-N-acetylglucosamine deacetylase